jgi:hypothetical protein
MTSRVRGFLIYWPCFLLVGFVLFRFSDTVADPDLWGHIRFGADIVRTGSIARTDTYSYRTKGQPWINHEWLSEVIFAGIYQAAGPQALIVFKVLVGLLIFGVSYGYLRHHGLGPVNSLLLLILVGIPFRMGLGTIRPQIFTYLFFLVVILILQKASSGREAWLWILPVLFVLWVNLHGGVLAGLGVLLLWVAIQVARRHWDGLGSSTANQGSAVGLGMLAAVCILAIFLNPYGEDLVRFLLRTATVPRPEISEWAALKLSSLPGLIYLVLVAIGVVGLVGSRRQRRPESIAILVITSVLALLSNRHYPLFALALIVFGGEHIADVASQRLPSRRLRLGENPVIAAAGILASLVLIGLAIPGFGCITLEPYYFAFPARAVAFLKQGEVRGNIAVPFDWGEYVIWHLGPAVKVSIDGRRETAYSDEAYRQSRGFELGSSDWDALLKTGKPTDLVLAPIGSPIIEPLSRIREWIPLYRDTCCIMFVRAHMPGLDRLLQTPVPPFPDNGNRLCFPSRNPAL